MTTGVHNKQYRPSQMQAYINALKRFPQQIDRLKYPPTLGKGITERHRDFLKGICLSLQVFGNEQFEFLYNGFEANSFPPHKSNYPSEYVINTTLMQIAHDLSVIERAIDQRRDEIKRDILIQADVLANDALGLARKGKLELIGTVAPITYLSKVPVIRVIPYAPVALIGVPYSVIGSATIGIETYRDYLSIAHEVGHYIYWHGTYNGGSGRFYDILNNRASESTRKSKTTGTESNLQFLYSHWLEEIFADVYACLVGGAATTLSIQDILLDNLPARRYLDDGDHPCAAVRPYVYFAVLNELGYASDLGKLRKTRWPEEVKDASKLIRLFIDHQPDQDAQPVQVTKQKMIEDLNEIVQRFLGALGLAKQEIRTHAPSPGEPVSNGHESEVDNRKAIVERGAWIKKSEVSGIRIAPADLESIKSYSPFTSKYVNKELIIDKFTGIKWPRLRTSADYTTVEWSPSDGGTLTREQWDGLLKLDTNKIRWLPSEKLPLTSDELIEKRRNPANWYEVFRARGWSSGGGDDAYPNRFD